MCRWWDWGEVMTFSELILALQAAGIDPTSYVIGNDVDISETYVIKRQPVRLADNLPLIDMWITYYAERGLQSGSRSFRTEDEACRFFLGWLMGDSTVQQSQDAARRLAKLGGSDPDAKLPPRRRFF